MTVENAESRPDAFLFLCHFTSRAILREFHKVAQATREMGESILLYHAKSDAEPAVSTSLRRYLFSDETLDALGYRRIGPSLVPGHSHFPVLQFHRDHPTFRHYWLIEYDVRFSGSWREFFASFRDSEADFLSCHLRRHDEEPDWPWWNLSHPSEAIAMSERLRSFNPICRLSNRSLIMLDDLLQDGWCGHYEVLLPTLLHRAGFRLVDFGGTGTYTPRGMENRCYTDWGTMRFRPYYWRVGRKPNMLYHPVKPWRMCVKRICAGVVRRCGSWISQSGVA